MKKNAFLNQLWLILLFVSVFLMSCSADKTTSPQTADLTPEDDVADIVGSNLALNTGGVIDQVEDLSLLLTNFSTKEPFSEKTVTREYDSTTGWWNITVERYRGEQGVIPYAHITKVYQLQYLNSEGGIQKNYITTENDTAYTVYFRILNGSGIHKTRRLSQNLLSLAGDWIITNAQNQTVSINGSYTKAASDTLSTHNGRRIMNHQLSLNFINVQGPRNNILNLHNKVAGVVNGTFVGDMTIVHGDDYAERHIERNIHIIFGNGVIDVTVGNKNFRYDALTGYPI